MILILSLISCSSKTEKELKPQSTKVSGDLESFMTVVDGTYKVELVSNEMSLNVKFKIEKLIETGKEFDEVNAQVVDDKGMPLTGVGNFFISKGLWAASDDNTKLDQAFKKGSGEVIVSLHYSDIGSSTKEEALKIIVDKGIKFIVNTKTKVIGITNNNLNESNIPGNFPFTSTRLLSQSDIESYSKSDLKLMRNEIFARYGYIFKTDDMKSYFSNQSWYKPQFTDVSNKMSEVEKKNIELIKAREPFAPESSTVDNDVPDFFLEDGTLPNNTSSNSNYDELLKSYENYIDQYIRLLKKAKNNDMSALSEYPSMMKKAQDLQSKIGNVQGQLNSSQIHKFAKLQEKLANAALELMK